MEESMSKSGYTCKGASARSWGSQLERKLNIEEQIQKEHLNIFDKSMITEEYVLKNLRKLAENSRNEADRIRANELLGKYLAMFTDKTMDVPMNKQDNQFSLDRLSRIKVQEEKIKPASEN